jgi:hypothetical protein
MIKSISVQTSQLCGFGGFLVKNLTSGTVASVNVVQFLGVTEVAIFRRLSVSSEVERRLRDLDHGASLGLSGAAFEAPLSACPP